MGMPSATKNLIADKIERKNSQRKRSSIKLENSTKGMSSNKKRTAVEECEILSDPLVTPLDYRIDWSIDYEEDILKSVELYSYYQCYGCQDPETIDESIDPFTEVEIDNEYSDLVPIVISSNNLHSLWEKNIENNERIEEQSDAIEREKKRIRLSN